jgi:hypothetical protein
MDPLRDVNRRDWEREETWCALGEMQGRGKAQRRGRRIAVRTATRICTTIGAEILMTMTRGYSHTATRHMAACNCDTQIYGRISRFARALPLQHHYATNTRQFDVQTTGRHGSTGTEYNLTHGSEVAVRGDLGAVANSDGRAAGRRRLVAGLRGKLVEQIDGACVHTCEKSVP